MTSRGSPWQYVRFFGMILIVAWIAWNIISDLRAGENHAALFARIVNRYHLVTDIYLEYNSTTYHFYGESLEPARSYLSLLLGDDYSEDWIPFEMIADDGAVFADEGAVLAKVWYYIGDTLLFSITISEAVPTALGLFIVEKTTGSRIFATAYVDGTNLRVVINSRRLNINNLVS